MAEYGATSNYKLPFPTDEADTDIAGDIKNLALGVDNAIGLNWDTATDEQKAAVGNATAPVRLYGTSRPDQFGTHGGAITAPPGSTYICAHPSLAANMGAREWNCVNGSGTWICTASRYAQYGVSMNGPVGDPFFSEDSVLASQIFIDGGRSVLINLNGNATKQYLPDPIQLGTLTQMETVNGVETNLFRGTLNINGEVWVSPNVYGANPIYQNANNPRRCWLDWQGNIYVWGGDWQTSEFSATHVTFEYLLGHDPNAYPYPANTPVFEPTTVTRLEAQIREAEQTKTSELDPSVVHLDAWKKQLTDMEAKA